MGYEAYDKYAAQYDAWFIKNGNVLETEATLVARTLKDAGKVLSIGCGSGLFEMLLKKHWGITVTDGIEPSVSMAEIARKRGMDITIGTAEEVGAHELDGQYDTLLFNGCPCYINDLGKAFANTSRFLRKGGRAIGLRQGKLCGNNGDPDKITAGHDTKKGGPERSPFSEPGLYLEEPGPVVHYIVVVSHYRKYELG